MCCKKIIGAGKPWHRDRFPCAKCGESLETTTLTEKESEIYWKGCSAKNFGPRDLAVAKESGYLVHVQKRGKPRTEITRWAQVTYSLGSDPRPRAAVKPVSTYRRHRALCADRLAALWEDSTASFCCTRQHFLEPFLLHFKQNFSLKKKKRTGSPLNSIYIVVTLYILFSQETKCLYTLFFL